MSHFEKVPYEEFEKCCSCILNEEEIKCAYKNIKLPKRSTTGSAGYDFYMPYPKRIDAHMYEKIPTGIRWVCDNDEKLVLLLLPRSGQGFKYGLRFANTCGVIDSDYCGSDNYGHIQAKFTVERDLDLKVGDAFMQGIIVPYITTNDDNASGIRNGGFGSTDNKESK